MRIIAGKFRGHRLVAPHGTTTRPTADRVRESIFNLLTTRVILEGSRVLDLFCGSGALGLEAISRGAGATVFVDTNRQALQAASENARALGVAESCSFLKRDGLRFLKNHDSSFDLIFADPPYTLPGIDRIPTLGTKILHRDGVLVLEHDKRCRFDDLPISHESRSYGRTIVTIFRPSPNPSSKPSGTE
jgi:16S rRNA (guanine(966)-N(2))-methyltransferase RsmD